MEILFLRRLAAVAFSDDLPDPLRTFIFVLPSTEIIAKQSPPTPVICGSATHKMAFIANAASTALPPLFKTSNPTDEARGWEDANIALEPVSYTHLRAHETDS